MSQLILFLNYAREDQEQVEQLYQRLRNIGLIPWMASKDIYPGENWEHAILAAIRGAHFFLVCLSSHSVNKRGFLQRELNEALRIWEEKLQDYIYLIPVRLEECQVPDRLRPFQWVNMYDPNGFQRILDAVQAGGKRLGIEVDLPQQIQAAPKIVEHTITSSAPYYCNVRYPQIGNDDGSWQQAANENIKAFAEDIVNEFSDIGDLTACYNILTAKEQYVLTPQQAKILSALDDTYSKTFLIFHTNRGEWLRIGTEDYVENPDEYIVNAVDLVRKGLAHEQKRNVYGLTNEGVEMARKLSQGRVSL